MSSFRALPELISVVVPVFNEAALLDEFYARLTDVMAGRNFEIVFVDDGSTDLSAPVIKEFQKKRNNILLVSLSRNFGHQIALTAGLSYARGDIVITMDADLQDPPELILKMLSKWQEGYEVVNTKRKKREDEKIIKRLTASIFYWVFKKISGLELHGEVGDFRLMDRKIVDGLKKIKERNRYIRGLISWMGYKQTNIEYVRPGRIKGKPKYSFWKSFVLAIDAITTFSYFPLRLASVVGFLFSFLAILVSLYVVILRLFTDKITISGYAALFVAITFLGGIQLIVLGILGEYLARCFAEARGRPLFYVKELVKSGVTEQKESEGSLLNGNLQN